MATLTATFLVLLGPGVALPGLPQVTMPSMRLGPQSSRLGLVGRAG